MHVPSAAAVKASDVCVFDIETENKGHRIREDNKRIISVQTAFAGQDEVYFADSKDPRFDLAFAKSKFDDLLTKNCLFAGFNIRKFDVPVLAEFLDVKLPESRMLDLMADDHVRSLAQDGIYGLENVCEAMGIPASHKQQMNLKTEECKTRPDIVTKANLVAPQIAKEKGGKVKYAFDDALKKIAGGTAIYESYTEFLATGCKKDSLFYQYAIGDVVCERRLLEALQT